MGSKQEADEAAFWPLVRNPVRLLWHIILEEGSRYLQERWDEILLEIKPLPPKQKQEVLYGKEGRITAFVNGPAKAFLERRGEQYVPKKVWDTAAPFSAPFLAYLRSARVGWVQPGLDDATRRITMHAAPADIVALPEGSVKVAKTTLSLDCDTTGKQTLTSPQGEVTFAWTAKSCFATTLQIYLADAAGQELSGVLERHYPDLAHFMDHFSTSPRVLHVSDFNANTLPRPSTSPIRSLTLHYRFSSEDRQQVQQDLDAHKRYQQEQRMRLELPEKIVVMP